MWHKTAPPKFDCRGGGVFLVRKTSILQSLRFQKCTNGTNMAAQQCRESRYFHGIICCYIGFTFFSHCKFQTGNPSRRCALQGSLWAGLAACSHAFLARSSGYPGSWRCFPKSGTAEDAIQLSREEVYLLSITMDSVEVWEWDGENKNFTFEVSTEGDGLIFWHWSLKCKRVLQNCWLPEADSI